MVVAFTATEKPGADLPAPTGPGNVARVLDAILNQAGSIPATELARRVGCSRSTVHHHRTGYTSPSPDQLAAYATVLGVPPGLFFVDPIVALRWLMDERPGYFVDD